MLAAVVSLLLAVLFYLISLIFYAKWFLAQDHLSPILGAHGFHNLLNLLIVTSTDHNDVTCSIKGLESSVISSIPQFIFREEDQLQGGLECVICLSLFENEEKGKKLALCHHAFHVVCIDMWLHSHTTCPICRAPAVQVSDNINVDSSSENHEINLNDEQSYGELVETTTRMSTEGDPSRLEIIVDQVPNTENG